jgi:glycosyltransferase involved in cell wall biosynthesis
VSHGHTGYLVQKEEEWLEALRHLMADPQLRRRLGQAGRRVVETTYSVGANRDRYLAIFAEAFGTPSLASSISSPAHAQNLS